MSIAPIVKASFTAGVLLTATLSPTTAWSQGLPSQQDNPAQSRPPLPDLPPLDESDQSGLLPRIPLPVTPDTEGLAAGHSVFVREIRLVGNTVLSELETQNLVAPYLQRENSFAELAALRDSLTRLYISRGYLNSGAVIPVQTVTNGVITIQMMEGRLGAIEYSTDGRFREQTILRRVRRGLTDPLNVNQLEQQLQVLQQDDRIDRVQAALVPGEERGVSKLRLQLLENKPVRVSLQMDNYESPSVGAEAARIQMAHTNVSGAGDRIEAGYDRTEGLTAVSGRYLLPLVVKDMSLDIRAKESKSDVIEAPFDKLDIESESRSYGLTLRYPLTHTAARNASLSASAEYRRSDSFLLGSPFAFGLGAEEGISKVAVLRLGYEWSYRSRKQALAARSVLSRGVDALGSTIHSGEISDSRFTSALLQAQWARRLTFWNAQISARGDMQLSDSPLLGLEQFALGGHNTVRGYRESTLVRDQGWVTSLEMRVPFFQETGGRRGVEVGTFFDHGRAWNKERATGEDQYLSSAGLAGRWMINRYFDVQLEWAKRRKDVPDSPSHDLQDEGVHVRVSAVY